MLHICFLILSLVLMSSGAIVGQSVLGRWLMIDDQSGLVKSEVDLYKIDGKLYGKVVKTLHPSANHLCDKCTGYRKNQPMLGMVILEDLEYVDGYWQNGRVLFPKQGKWYDVSIWLDPGNPDRLVLRGYWGPIFRTQYWMRAK